MRKLCRAERDANGWRLMSVLLDRQYGYIGGDYLPSAYIAYTMGQEVWVYA